MVILFILHNFHYEYSSFHHFAGCSVPKNYSYGHLGAMPLMIPGAWQVFLSNPNLNLSDTETPLYNDPVVRSELLWSRQEGPPTELFKCRLVNM